MFAALHSVTETCCDDGVNGNIVRFGPKLCFVPLGFT